MRSTTLAAPLLRALQRAILARGAGRCVRAALPGLDEEGSTPTRATPSSTATRPRARRGRAGRRLPLDPGAGEHACARPGSTRRGSPARPRRAPLSEPRLQKRWCGTLWPTQAWPSRPAWARRLRRLRRGALFLDRADPVAAWRELGRLPGRADRAADAGEHAAHRGRGDRPDARRRRPHVGQLRRQTQHAQRRGLHRPASRSRRQRHVASRSPAPAGVDVEGVELEFRDGEVVAPAPRAARSTSTARSRPTPAPAASARSGIGTNFGIDRPIGAILFDEKIGGTVHLALGRCYPETGGKNESAVHWDLICDLRGGGRLTADGEDVRPTAGSCGHRRRRTSRLCAGRRSSPRSARLTRPRDPRADGRGGDGRRPAELQPRRTSSTPRTSSGCARPRAGRAPVAILQDLPGPKLRIGPLADGHAELRRRHLTLDGGRTRSATRGGCSIAWAGLADAVEPGEVMYLADGSIRLRVEARARATARSTRASRSAAPSPRARGSTSPARPPSLPAVPEEDLEHAASARRSASTSWRWRSCGARRTSRRCASTPARRSIAKIEKPQAVERAEEIVRESDCIMVARGDLGIELPIEQVPLVQKRLLALAGASRGRRSRRRRCSTRWSPRPGRPAPRWPTSPTRSSTGPTP